MRFLDEVRAVAHAGPPKLVYAAHRSPGRLRFRLTWLSGDSGDGTRLADALSQLPGVVRVKVRPFTGSVLILFDPTVSDADEITRALLSATGVDHVSVPGKESRADLESILGSSHREGSDLSRAILQAVQALHVDFLRQTGGQVSLGALVALAMWTGAAASVIARGELELPAWHELVWMGYKAFYDLEATAIDRMPDPVRAVASRRTNGGGAD